MSMKRMWTQEEIGGQGGQVVTHHITLEYDDGTDLGSIKFDVVNGSADSFSDSDITNLLAIAKVATVDWNGEDTIGIIRYIDNVGIKLQFTSSVFEGGWTAIIGSVDKFSLADEME